MVLWPDSTRAELQKFSDIFMRRLERGQCYERPFFGMREYSCEFAPASPDLEPARIDQNLGAMPLQLVRVDDPAGPLMLTRHRRDGQRWLREQRPGRVETRYFQASLRGGIIEIPEYPVGGL